MSEDEYDVMEARLKTNLDQEVEALVEKYESTPEPELGAPPFFWDIFARGPRQAPRLAPGRIIEVGEVAFIETVVVLNPRFPRPMSACSIITQFAACIQLNYVTSNMQTMRPVPQASGTFCIPTTPNVCRYTHIYRFRPPEPGCLYETNVCARICNCDHKYVSQFSAFAWWVENFDDALFRRPAQFTFDHPIRYMVADPKGECCPGCPPP